MILGKNLYFGVWVATLIACAQVGAAVWHVDKSNVLGVKDGTSWSTAYRSIQPAINAAFADGGGEVWVAAGVYDEARSSLMHDPVVDTGSLVIRPGVALYGGFAGGEIDRSERDWRTNETVISGATSRGGFAARHVIVSLADASLDGFTVSGGHAEGSSPHERSGGGLFSDRVPVNVANCIFEENSAHRHGGAIACFRSNANLSNSVVRHNTAGSSGGGMLADSGSRVINCVFHDNEAGSVGGALDLGGDNTKVYHCTIWKNHTEKGGAIFLRGDTHDRPAFIRSSILWANTAGESEPPQLGFYGPRMLLLRCIVGLGAIGDDIISEDPAFLDPESGDFRLRPNSPALDAGAVVPGLEVDLAGNPRFQGSRPDIGALEFLEFAPDQDADGIPDSYEGMMDHDGDGRANRRDTDSDNDGIFDAVELMGDPDDDGLPNYLDDDSDGDGIGDDIEGAGDTDGDDTPNYLDEDSDGDGSLDFVEGALDVDGDGSPNFLDWDSSGDGIPDFLRPLTVIFVDGSNGSGVRDGTSWQRAFGTIQEGVDAAYAAGGGHVWVAGGTYRAALAGTTEYFVKMREGVKLYGGFSGGEKTLDARDIRRYETEIDGMDFLGTAIILGADHSSLDGFTVSKTNHRAVMLNEEVSPEVVNCTFRGNNELYERIMFRNTGGAPTYRRCLWEDNALVQYGKIMTFTRSDATLVDCRFSHNNGIGHPENFAVGVYSSRVRFSGTNFSDNRDVGFLASGGSTVTLENSTILNNSSNMSLLVRQIRCFTNVRNTVFAMNTFRDRTYGVAFYHNLSVSTLENSLFLGNAISGGVAVETRDANLSVVNSTFSGNGGGEQGGGIATSNGNTTVQNSVLWGNFPTEFFGPRIDGRIVEFSLVRGGHEGEGNLALDPEFRGGADMDPRLTSVSPAIDVGDPSVAPPTDILGVARPQGAGVDLGAFEFEVVLPTLCESRDVIQDGLAGLRFIAELYGDLDEDGLPEAAGLELLATAACAYDTSKGVAAERAFELNLLAVDREPFDMRILRKRAVISALMSVSAVTQRALRDGLAEEGVVLLENYYVVACDDPGTCEALLVSGTARAAGDGMDYPYSGPGDYDGDGVSNAEEWAAVLASGGSFADFLAAVTDPSVRAVLGGSSSGGGCFIATAAYGTPLAGEIYVLRGFRDRWMLTNAVGGAFADAYYRLSPSIARQVSADEGLRGFVRVALYVGMGGLRHPVGALMLLCLIFVSAGIVSSRPRLSRSVSSDSLG